jgi:hypothetical protein
VHSTPLHPHAPHPTATHHTTQLPSTPPLAARSTPPLLYELYICAREEDTQCGVKLELLAACGLGCVHYLTEGLESQVC